MTTDTSPNPAAIWAQSMQTWADAWGAFFTGALPGGAAQGDPFQMWQKSLDQWVAGWSAFFDQTLTTPETAAAGGRTLDQMLNIEKPLRERTAATMQLWLE